MKKISYIDLSRQYALIKEELLDAIDHVCSQGSFILRQEVSEFEKKFAKRIGVKHAVGVNSGADALWHSLRLLGVTSGDEVISVSHTFVATLAAIHHCGAKPILADIREDFNADPELIGSLITKKTKAILPVHMNGRVCDMDAICKIADKNDLLVVEDAAQAFGALYKNQNAGVFGSAGCFSLHPMKNLGVWGDGGVVTTNSDELAQNILKDRDHGQNQKREVQGYGFSSRLDNVHAAIGLVKLKYIDDWINRRRVLAKQYHAELASFDELILPPSPDEDDTHFDVYSSYVIRTGKRDELRSYLLSNGIEVFTHWDPPLHKNVNLHLEESYLPVTDMIAKESVSLPIHHALDDIDQEYIINTIKAFFKLRTPYEKK